MMIANAIAQPLTRMSPMVWRSASFAAIFAIALLVLLVGRAHRPLPVTPGVQVRAVVAGFNVASIDDVCRTRRAGKPAQQQRRQRRAGAAAAAAMNSAPVLHFASIRMPATSGPMIEPIRPMPSAQPTPVARTEVG